MSSLSGRSRFQRNEIILADNFADAILILGASSSYGPGILTATFTTEEDEPTGSNLTNGIHETVWFKWVAPASGTATFDTHGSLELPIIDESDLDTTLAVWTGTSLGDLVEVASNDDDPDDGLNSLVSFSATEGTTYWIQVGTYDETVPGQLFLNWELV